MSCEAEKRLSKWFIVLEAAELSSEAIAMPSVRPQEAH